MPYLIKTALSEKPDGGDDIVLLGEWCRLYARRDSAMESIPVIPYHWDDREKLGRDFDYLQALNRRLLKDLTSALNQLHGVSYSEQYWYLLLGYWLNVFTAVLFDRRSCLNEAVVQYDELKTVIYPVTSEVFVPKGTSEALSFFQEDWWNHALYARLIKDFPRIEVVVASDGASMGEIEGFPVTEVRSGRVSGKRRFGNALNQMYHLGRRESRYTIARSGLSFMQEAQLALRLGCVPHRITFPDVKSLPLDSNLREWTIAGNTGKDSFDCLVRTLLPQMIPRVFLEGFNSCRQVLQEKSYPKSSNVIFTSHSHFTDDVFKVWAGEQCEQGERLVIGQHGSGAFHKFNGATSYELSISDAYVSTGNGNCEIDDRIKDVGRFNNKFKIGKWDPNGHATLVTVAMPRYAFDIRAMPIAGQMLSYFEDQFLFYEKLCAKIRGRLHIRIYPKGDYGWNQRKRWLDRFPEVILDEGHVSLSVQASRSRLMIATYNATTYNESLAANLPTVMYWDPHYWELREAAQPWFEELKSVGIFHETPESAATHVKKIWHDVRGWWQSESVQEARARYCRRYAHLPPDVLSRLANVLKHEGSGLK